MTATVAGNARSRLFQGISIDSEQKPVIDRPCFFPEFTKHELTYQAW